MVLVVAGLNKIGDADGFARTVLSYELVSWPASRLVGRWLPVLEVVVGAALVLGPARPMAASVATAMFLVFTAALWVNRLRGRTELSCGCFGGSAPTRLTPFVLARPAVLAVGALVVASGALGPAGALAPAERAVAAAAGALPVLGLAALTAVRSMTAGPAPTAPGHRVPSPPLPGR